MWVDALLFHYCSMQHVLKGWSLPRDFKDPVLPPITPASTFATSIPRSISSLLHLPKLVGVFKIKPLTTLLLIAALVALSASQTQLMLPLRNFLASFSSRTASSMVKKTPPPPTVPAAIKSSEEAKPSDAGWSALLPHRALNAGIWTHV